MIKIEIKIPLKFSGISNSQDLTSGYCGFLALDKILTGCKVLGVVTNRVMSSQQNLMSFSYIIKTQVKQKGAGKINCQSPMRVVIPNCFPSKVDRRDYRSMKTKLTNSVYTDTIHYEGVLCKCFHAVFTACPESDLILLTRKAKTHENNFRPPQRH
jgi:hypothetical protein